MAQILTEIFGDKIATLDDVSKSPTPTALKNKILIKVKLPQFFNEKSYTFRLPTKMGPILPNLLEFPHISLSLQQNKMFGITTAVSRTLNIQV